MASKVGIPGERPGGHGEGKVSAAKETQDTGDVRTLGQLPRTAAGIA